MRGSAVPAVAARSASCAEIGPSRSTSTLSSSVSVSGSTSLMGLVLALFSPHDQHPDVGERFVSVLGRCARTLVRMALLVRTWLRGSCDAREAVGGARRALRKRTDLTLCFVDAIQIRQPSS